MCSSDLIDDEIGLEFDAIITGISRDLTNPENTSLTISNVVTYSSYTTAIANAADTVDRITDSVGKIDGMYIANATIGSAQIGLAVIDTAHIRDASIDSAKIQKASINSAHIAEGTIIGANIAEASIGSAHISELSADVLNSGTIDTSKLRISGTGSAMEITGNQILINDIRDLLKVKNRVILGQYVNTKGETEYGLLVRSEDGQTTMIDGYGVHNAGLTSDAIKDNVIAPDADIDGSKLNIATTISAINNSTGAEKINGLKIDIDGKTLSIAFSEINTLINGFDKNIQNNTAAIEHNANEIALKVSQEVYLKDKIDFDNDISDINNRFDSLKLSGNNLLSLTRNFGSAKWNNVDLVTSGGEQVSYLGCKVAKLKGKTALTSPSTTLSNHNLTLEIGEEYTISCEAKGTKDGLKIGCIYGSEEKTVATNKFTQFSWTFKIVRAHV